MRASRSFCDLMNILLTNYRNNAKLHGICTFSGDSKQTNRAYDELLRTLKVLVSNNADNLLFSLYEDDDLFVQLWVAAHTLELDEQRAIDKLQGLVDSGAPIVSMSAKYTISGWNEGGLRVRT